MQNYAEVDCDFVILLDFDTDFVDYDKFFVYLWTICKIAAVVASGYCSIRSFEGVNGSR